MVTQIFQIVVTRQIYQQRVRASPHFVTRDHREYLNGDSTANDSHDLTPDQKAHYGPIVGTPQQKRNQSIVHCLILLIEEGLDKPSDYITLHCVLLHYITLHYVTLRYIT